MVSLHGTKRQFILFKWLANLDPKHLRCAMNQGHKNYSQKLQIVIKQIIANCSQQHNITKYNNYTNIHHSINHCIQQIKITKAEIMHWYTSLSVTHITRTITECKPPPTSKFKPKVIRDSNLDCRINPDPDVCRICPKMLWIHYLVGSVISPRMVEIGRWLYEKC